jgi:hypothetical protein
VRETSDEEFRPEEVAMFEADAAAAEAGYSIEFWRKRRAVGGQRWNGAA